jgi:hypothetical protein
MKKQEFFIQDDGNQAGGGWNALIKRLSQSMKEN